MPKLDASVERVCQVCGRVMKYVGKLGGMLVYSDDSVPNDNTYRMTKDKISCWECCNK